MYSIAYSNNPLASDACLPYLRRHADHASVDVKELEKAGEFPAVLPRISCARFLETFPSQCSAVPQLDTLSQTRPPSITPNKTRRGPHCIHICTTYLSPDLLHVYDIL